MTPRLRLRRVSRRGSFASLLPHFKTLMNVIERARVCAATAPPAWHESVTAFVLHWRLAFLFTAMVALSWHVGSIEDKPGSGWYFDLHKSIGLGVARLVGARIGWRLTHRPQPLAPTVPKGYVRSARAMQALLDGLMVLIPLTGYLGASQSKAGVSCFGMRACPCSRRTSSTRSTIGRRLQPASSTRRPSDHMPPQRLVYATSAIATKPLAGLWCFDPANFRRVKSPLAFYLPA